MGDSDRAVGSLDDLLAFFYAGETPESDWAIGTEHEKIGVYEATGERVPYEGEYGVGALLRRISECDGWKPVYEEENVIALLKDGASITLEPGGQIELSGAPLRTIRETCREFNNHVDLVKDVASDFGIAWLALGVDPLHEVSEIPVMPKHRYEIMRSYLPTRGSLALDMMHASATVQANFDFSSEADMVSKLRMAMGCTPIVSAIFANSPVSAGRETGYVSKRVAIWRDTDPDRCGILHFVFDEGFGYREYAEWALDVPMFFLIKDESYIPAEGTTFRQYMERGFAGHHATEQDWNMHLTTLFPEVRLKQVIEVRGADAVPRDLICALPALWKGLLYDAEACEAAWSLVSGFSREQREAAQVDVAHHGLGAQIGGRPALELADELVSISDAGLRRIASRTGLEADECSFLDPIRVFIERGKSPGELFLERWREGASTSRERLIEYSRY
jgi:glutamate--cysteine ligase